MGNKGEEIKVCPVLKALCADNCRKVFVRTSPSLKLCHMLKTLLNFQAQPTQASVFQREALTCYLLIFLELRWRNEDSW